MADIDYSELEELTLNMEEGNFGVSTYIFKNVSVGQLY